MNILITNLFIKNFTGSEINALQLCDALRDLGHSTDVATFFYDHPIKELFERRNINVINLLSENFELNNYDLFWTHHIHTINHLIINNNPPPTKIIYSCLGPFSTLATPPFYHDQLNYILSNSRGNSDVLVSEGINKHKIYYFPNYAPKSFFNQQKECYSKHPTKIAVISNHPADELQEFAVIASHAGIIVDFIGFGGKQIYVDANFLKEYDLVISIGKTAQYCFSVKVPFYCYDHFGGPGYITPDNLYESETYNFSGRAINRKLTGKELFEDITSNYHLSLTHLDYFSNYCYHKFVLENNIIKLIEHISNSDKVDFTKIREKHPLLNRHHNEFLRLIKIQQKLEYQVEQQHVSPLNNSIIHHQKADLEQEVLNYAMSKSWRLTRPIRKIAKKVRKFFNDKIPD